MSKNEQLTFVQQRGTINLLQHLMNLGSNDVLVVDVTQGWRYRHTKESGGSITKIWYGRRPQHELRVIHPIVTHTHTCNL